MAALAFNQNKFELAADISARYPNDVACKQIQWQCLIELGAIGEVLNELSIERIPHVCSDVVGFLRRTKLFQMFKMLRRIQMFKTTILFVLI